MICSSTLCSAQGYVARKEAKESKILIRESKRRRTGDILDESFSTAAVRVKICQD